MHITDEQFEEASKKADEYTEKAQIDFFDLSPQNVKKADVFLQQSYKDWKEGKIDDMTAHTIGGNLEGEPIHHLMETSVYPLCDIWFHLSRDEFDVIQKMKDKVK